MNKYAMFHPCCKNEVFDYRSIKVLKEQMKTTCRSCDYALDSSCDIDPLIFYTSEDYLYNIENESDFINYHNNNK